MHVQGGEAVAPAFRVDAAVADIVAVMTVPCFLALVTQLNACQLVELGRQWAMYACCGMAGTSMFGKYAMRCSCAFKQFESYDFSRRCFENSAVGPYELLLAKPLLMSCHRFVGAVPRSSQPYQQLLISVTNAHVS
jgi:hypothetical protein